MYEFFISVFVFLEEESKESIFLFIKLSKFKKRNRKKKKKGLLNEVIVFVIKGGFVIIEVLFDVELEDIRFIISLEERNKFVDFVILQNIEEIV